MTMDLVSVSRTCVVFLLCLVYDVASSLGPSDSDSSLTNKILSPGGIIKAHEGETVLFRCDTSHREPDLVMLWKKDENEIITAGPIKISRDDRISLIESFSLEIQHVNRSDEGHYMCSYNTRPPMEQVYTLEIMVPPTVHRIPADGLLTARKGEAVTLQCNPEGKPKPKITWIKKSEALIGSTQPVKHQTLVLDNVSRHHSGEYQCTATNGIGAPATAIIELQVIYLPEISLEKSWTKNGMEYTAQISCIVHAEPPPSIMWYRRGQRLQANDIIRQEVDDKYIVTIKNIEESDYDTYTCIAENNLGEVKKVIEVTGLANPVKLLQVPEVAGMTTYGLHWQVESYSPIIDYKIQYKRTMINGTKDPRGEWAEYKVPADLSTGRNRSPIQNGSLRLSQLQPASTYEVKIYARNKFGWNEPSDIFTFSTSDRDITSEASMSRRPLSGGSHQVLGLVTLISCLLISVFPRL